MTWNKFLKVLKGVYNISGSLTMSKEFPIVDIEFLQKLGDYIKFHADAYKYKFNDIPNKNIYSNHSISIFMYNNQ